MNAMSRSECTIAVLEQENAQLRAKLAEEQELATVYAEARKRIRDLEAEVMRLREIDASLNAMPAPAEEPKCKFCGDTGRPLDKWGHCDVCVAGMERTNGD